jgi:hypothetical protein
MQPSITNRFILFSRSAASLEAKTMPEPRPDGLTLRHLVQAARAAGFAIDPRPPSG